MDAKMTREEFFRYTYAYYLVAKQSEATAGKVSRIDELCCQIFRNLIAKAIEEDRSESFLPRLSRFHSEALVYLLPRSEVAFDPSIRAQEVSAFWRSFLPERENERLFSNFPGTESFEEWFLREEAAGLYARTRQQFGHASVEPLRVADFQYRGAIVMAIDRDTMLFQITANAELLAALKQAYRTRSKKNDVFGTKAKVAHIRKQVLAGQERFEPNYWLGADVTALIDVDSCVPRKSHLLDRAHSSSPFSEDMFDTAVNALCNDAGIYCMSLFQFPEEHLRTPIMRVWRELADYWAQARALPEGILDNKVEHDTEKLVETAATPFEANYPSYRFGDLARWLEVQINNRNSVAIFANDRNTSREIEMGYRQAIKTKAGRSFVAYARAQQLDFNLSGNDRAGRLKPNEYAAGYAYWSFAKAAPYKDRAPSAIDHLVSSQRLPLHSPPLKTIKPDASRIFPWGPVLRHLVLHLKGCDDNWLADVLRHLRTYTILNLDTLLFSMELARPNHRQVSVKTTWLIQALRSLDKFAVKGLLEITQMEVSRHNRQGEIDGMDVLLKAIASCRRHFIRFLVTRRLITGIANDAKSTSAVVDELYGALDAALHISL
jgi:hypothetical protein